MQLSARYPFFVFATVVALGALSMELRGAPPPRFADRIEPILVEYCYDCHGDGAEKGDFALDTHRNHSELLADHKIWERVWENLHRRMMPPGTKRQGARGNIGLDRAGRFQVGPKQAGSGPRHHTTT